MVIAVTNQKGGCAKTTTSVNIATVLAEGNRKYGIPPSKVLLIDLDPQGNVSTSFGIDKSKLKKTVSDVLMNDLGEQLPLMDEFIISPDLLTESMRNAWSLSNSSDRIPKSLKINNLYLLPSNIHLSGADIELSTKIGRETRLKEGIAHILHDFDYIIIDTPPSLGLLTINALAASNWVLTPVQAEYYALEGMSLLMNTIKLVQRRINPNLKLFGIAMTMVLPKSTLSRMVCEEVSKYFPNQVFNTLIQRLVKIAEAPSEGSPTVLLHRPGNDSKGKGSHQYWTLGKEIHHRVEELMKKHGVTRTSQFLLNRE
ncbi:MAG: ParA family protein [Methanobacteriota archaeon]|nr:MAG: ParA family protein [Euryarchaeota archaeon]